MKRILLVFIVMVFVISAGGLSRGNAAGAEDIAAFFADFFREYISRDPEYLTQLGDLSMYGIDSRNDQLTDRSLAAEKGRLEFYRQSLEELQSFPRTALDEQQQLSADILQWFLEQKLSGEEFVEYGYAVNQLWGIQLEMPDFLTNTHPLNNREDIEDYLARMEQIETVFQQVLEKARTQEEKGIIPPAYIIRIVIRQCQDFIRREVEQNILYTDFVRRGRMISLSEEELQAYQQEVAVTLEESVYPAYQRMLAYLEELEPKAAIQAGVWELPDGDAYYQYLLRDFTTTNLTPEEIYNYGIEQVAQIQEEVKKILQDMNSNALAFGIGYALANLRSEVYYDRQEIFAKYRELIDGMELKLPELFTTLPAHKVQLAPVPDFREDSISNYYSTPALDGSNPGTFYINLSFQQVLHRMATLAYHEAIPGHHLQLAIQRENQDLPLFRRAMTFLGYTEGWGLYAEKLAGEYGFHEDPVIRLGYLQSELLRASRLVIDTGIHYKRWNREEALDYFFKVNGYQNPAEVYRYIIWPGQAVAYKVGEMKILELRERAREELGERFNIKEFHRVILENGSIPLEILEKEVDRYIEEVKQS
ncbi:MAG: DUF885 domain-containing protein [Halanaerobium sp.]|nr:DUF885 domain-containing protein [Halanaerobium sp.]